MPYALVGHMHEREVTRQLGRPVEFMPHVAPHFRGITMTVNLHLSEPVGLEAARGLYRERYAGEPLVRKNVLWLAREIGVDIQQVPGSGPNGRISQDDVKAPARRILSRIGTSRGAAPRCRFYAESRETRMTFGILRTLRMMVARWLRSFTCRRKVRIEQSS